MDIQSDGNLIIQGEKAKLIKVKEKDIEIIETIEDVNFKEDKILYILSNNRIIKYNIIKKSNRDWIYHLDFYYYNSGKIINQNQSNKLTSKTIFINDICEINENELIIAWWNWNILDIIMDNSSCYLYFYDINKNKKKELKIGTTKDRFIFGHLCLINKDTLVLSFDKKILLVDLIKKDILKKVLLVDDYYYKKIKIISLNENNFLVQNNNRINHYEIQNKKNIILKGTLKIEDMSKLFEKYGNKFIIESKKGKIMIYG